MFANVFYIRQIVAKNQLFEAVIGGAGREFPLFPAFHSSKQLPAQNFCEIERVVGWILDLAIFTLNASKHHLDSLRVQMMFFFNFLIPINVMLMKVILQHFPTNAHMTANKRV